LESICPLCQGRIQYAEPCPKCGTIMKEIGKVDDFFDPYGSYIGKEIYSMSNDIFFLSGQQCVHLTQCEICGFYSHVSIPPVIKEE
jgi:hypothetical protein